MRAFLVIVSDKLLNDLPKVAFTKRYDARETLVLSRSSVLRRR